MAGLWRTTAIFAFMTAVFWIGDKWDVRDEFTALDAMFWFYGIGTVGLSIRAVVELLSKRTAGGDQRIHIADQQ